MKTFKCAAHCGGRRSIACGFVVAVGAALLGFVPLDASAAKAGALAGLDRYIEQVRTQSDNVGLAVAVVRGDETIYAAGFGSREAGAAARVDADTLFEIGSLTKAFTAAALGTLVDDGKIGWDDAVIDHVPEFRIRDASLTASITIRDALAHRTGLLEEAVYYPFFGIMTGEQTVRELRHVTPDAAFRDSFRYNNVMYAAAGAVAAAASGRTWNDLIRQRLLQPLQMNRTGTSAYELWDARHVAPSLFGSAPANVPHANEARDPNVAMPHGHDANGAVVTIPWSSYDSAAAAGSMYSSATEMANWMRMHLNEGRFAGRQVLSPQVVQALHASQNLHVGSNQFPFDAASESYALGWSRAEYRGEVHLAHSGGIIGFPAYVALLPGKKLGVVVLSNGPTPRRITLHKTIALHVFDRLLGKPARDWNAEFSEQLRAVQEQAQQEEDRLQKSRPQNAQPSLPLDRYAGTYVDPIEQSNRVYVRAEKDTLTLTYPGAGAYKAGLQPWRDNQFRLLSGPGVSDVLHREFANFNVDALGQVTSMSAFGATLQRLPDQDLLALEASHDAKVLAWARSRTQQSIERLRALPAYKRVSDELDKVLEGSPTEPTIHLLGSRALRVAVSAAKPFGELQIAARDQNGRPGEWQTVLDVARLRKQSGVAYELKTYWLEDACLPPEYRRCLLRLSPGGGEEVEIREFDLQTGEFVDGGLHVPKSRAMTAWLSADTIAVAQTATAPRTAAGWPATVQLWRRGQSLQAARTIYRAEPTDAVLLLSSGGSGASRYAVITRMMDLSSLQMRIIRQDGSIESVALPSHIDQLSGVSALTACAPGAIFVQLTQDTEIAGRTYPAKTLIAYATDPSVPAAQRISVVYQAGVDEFLGAPLTTTRDHVAFTVTRRLVPKIMVATRDGGQWSARELMQAQPGQSVTNLIGSDVDNDLIATSSGWVTPSRQVLYRADAREQLLATDRALFDSVAYTTEIRSAQSRDGTSIDYYLLRPRAPKRPGAQPLLVTGYAAFGMSFVPTYLNVDMGGPSLKLWLDRGGSVVMPAARGGSERGEAWHRAALREKRQNSYDDFIAVVQQLVQSGYTEPSRIGVFGRSNGGLMAAVLGTQRPDLFSAVVSDVPATDLVRMKHIAMGAAWVNEFGDADDPAMRQVIERYSPLQNVRTGVAYPPFLITTSTEDDQAGPAHARKLAARLEAVGSSVYFYEDPEGGHGVSDAYRNPQLMALRMTFLINSLMKE